MTPLPKRRLSTRRQTQREKGLKLSLLSSIKCTNCHESVLRHHVCRHCGFYNGKQVVNIKVKKNKTQKE